MTTEPDPSSLPRYVFSVTVRIQPRADVRVEPDTFETTLYRPADPPTEAGWRFFRDNLWRGSLADPDHFRRLTEDGLGVPVVDVTYRRFETDPASYDELRAAIAEDLDAFNATTVSAVISKYFGSSIEVRRLDS